MSHWNESLIVTPYMGGIQVAAPLLEVEPYSSNKSRLYIAFYTRGVQKTAGIVEIDAALFLAPKNPKHARSTESWRFQVSKNRRGSWEFVGRTTKNRSSRLRAVMLLGKVNRKITGEDVRDLLADVLVMQDEQMWGRIHWTKDAIQTLIEHEVIAPPEGNATPWEIVQKGFNFAGGVKHDPSRPVPTCNQEGRSITSEIK